MDQRYVFMNSIIIIVCLALDMQTCGLTSNTAHLCQSLLRTNKGLLIMDIRQNALMG